jgi:hypothetical protein
VTKEQVARYQGQILPAENRMSAEVGDDDWAGSVQSARLIRAVQADGGYLLLCFKNMLIGR